MTRIMDNRAVLAIDPGPRGVAFVFFENGTLLDWGTRGRGCKELEVLEAMLDRFRADVLILEDAEAFGCERRARWKHIVRRMAERARTRGVVVETVSRYAVRHAWAADGKTNKHEVATAIAALFPEMEPCVPRARRDWDSEDTRTGVFDAFSLLLHVRESETGEVTPKRFAHARDASDAPALSQLRERTRIPASRKGARLIMGPAGLFRELGGGPVVEQLD